MERTQRGCAIRRRATPAAYTDCLAPRNSQHTKGISLTTFHDFQLSPSLLRALDSMKIHTPTPIQVQTIPALLDRRDVIGQAATGSGKTLAFGLPLVQGISPKERGAAAIVVVPTRELAQQVGMVLSGLVRGTSVHTAIVFGGRKIGPQEKIIRRGAQIIVGTPGRLVDLMNRGTLRLNRIRYLVLDEADEMLDRGFQKDVEHILGATPQERQTALFSATTPRWVHDVSSKYLSEPIVIELGADEESKPDIDHVIYEVGGQDKFHVLQRLLDETTTGSTLVFGRTKHGVRKLGQRLERSGYHVGVLHGNLSQPQRDRVLRQFTAKKMPVLLATNVAARGLDVDHIERVINYELPETHDLFTHRVGRTGRMGRSGIAITLLGPADMTKWDKLERGLGRKLLRRTLDGRPVPERAGTNKNGNRNENGNGSGVRRSRHQFHQGSLRPAPRADVAGRSRRPSQRRRRPASQPLRA